jgi:hypothetical protein
MHSIALMQLRCVTLCAVWHACRFVEQGLLQFGKKFNALAAVMGEPAIKVCDCVEFYYNWKHQPETAVQYAKWQEHRRLVSYSICASTPFNA